MDSAQLKAKFDNDGFLHLQKFFQTEEVNQWAGEFERFIAEKVPSLPRAQAMYDDYDDPSTLKQINNLQESDDAFDKLLNDSRLMELASVLLDDEVFPNSAAAFVKAPLKGTPTPAHQDGYYFCLQPNEAVTVWMPIGDIDADNGALCYIKGSHKNGIMAHGASGVLGFSQGLAGDAPPGEEVVCAVEKGDLLIHHSRTIHFAAGNNSSRPRRSLGLVYYAATAQEDPMLKEEYDRSLQAQQAQLGVK